MKSKARAKNPTFDEAAELLDAMRSLSSTVVIRGILLYVNPHVRFTEQDLLRFLRAIDVAGKFGIKQGESELYSRSVYNTIAFMQIGYFLQDWGDHFEIDSNMQIACKKYFTERGVLPKYEKFFQNLGQQFVASLKK